MKYKVLIITKTFNNFGARASCAVSSLVEPFDTEDEARTAITLINAANGGSSRKTQLRDTESGTTVIAQALFGENLG